jgi:hypothetical protein
MLLEKQSGFRRGSFRVDNVFTFKQTKDKRQDFNKETSLMFIDYIKAFDSVSRCEL